MNKLPFFILSILMLSLPGCLEELVPQERAFPVVRLLKPEVNEDGVRLSSEIYSIGESQIIEHGYEWALRKADFDIAPTRLILPFKEPLQTGISEVLLDRDLLPNQTYQLRYYIQMENYKVISNTEFFESRGSKRTPWSSQAKFPGNNNGSNAGITRFTVNNKLYIYLDSPQTFWNYAPNENKWNALNAPTNFGYNDYLFSFSNKAYFFFNASLWEYDTSNNSYKTTGSELSFQPYPIFSFSFEALKKGYVYTNEDSFVAYDANTGTWDRDKARPPFSMQRARDYSYLSTFTIGNTGYVIGPDENSAAVFLYTYDPLSNQWSKKFKIEETVQTEIVVFALNEASVFIGKRGVSGPSERDFFQFWEYNVQQNTRLYLGRAPFKDPIVTVAKLDEKYFIGSGIFEITNFVSFDATKLKQ